MNKTTLYIAYGSNLNLEQMAHRCPTAKVVGTSELEGYELLFRGSRRSAVATVEPKEGSSVPVIIWKLKERDLRALDRYEGWPSFYRKEIHPVELKGKTILTMVYMMNEGREFGNPSPFYYNTIREGYENAGFAVDFLDDAVEHSALLALERDRQWEQAELEQIDYDEHELDDLDDDQELDDPDQNCLFGMKWW